MGIKRFKAVIHSIDYRNVSVVLVEDAEGTVVTYNDHTADMVEKDEEAERLLRAQAMVHASNLAELQAELTEKENLAEATRYALEDEVTRCNMVTARFTELQAKCERMEAALRGLIDSHADLADFPAINQARTALTETK